VLLLVGRWDLSARRQEELWLTPSRRLPRANTQSYFMLLCSANTRMLLMSFLTPSSTLHLCQLLIVNSCPLLLYPPTQLCYFIQIIDFNNCPVLLWSQDLILTAHVDNLCGLACLLWHHTGWWFLIIVMLCAFVNRSFQGERQPWVVIDCNEMESDDSLSSGNLNSDTYEPIEVSHTSDDVEIANS
jgi:hypothetical protein